MNEGQAVQIIGLLEQLVAGQGTLLGLVQDLLSNGQLVPQILAGLRGLVSTLVVGGFIVYFWRRFDL